MIVIVPVLGRPETLIQALPAIRNSAGIPVELCLVVDGDPNTSWHHVQDNADIGGLYADRTIVLGSHKGNGAAMQAATWNLYEPYAKVDADVVPNEGWLKGLRFFANLWDTDGKLGCLNGIPTGDKAHTNVGPRRYHAGRRLFLHIALFTEVGAKAVGDQTTNKPINGHDLLVASRLQEAGLWQAYCHAAYTAIHLQGTDPEYDNWKKPFLNRGIDGN